MTTPATALLHFLSATILSTGVALAQNTKGATTDPFEAANRYKAEAMALDPYDLYTGIMEAFAKVREDGSSPIPDLRSDNIQRGTGYSMALEQKSKDGDPLATHYQAILRMHTCKALEDHETEANTRNEASRNCWTKARTGLEAAYRAGVSRSASAIATMYHLGWGVAKSKYLAAEWHLRAATANEKDGDRNAALLSMEQAETLVPDHPEVMKMKARLLAPQGR